MVSLLGALHAFGGEDAVQSLLPEKLRNHCASDAVVDPLLVLGVYLVVFGTHAVELPEGVLVDVVVHLAADQLLKEVIAFWAYATWSCGIISLQQQLDHALRFLLLLDVGEDEADDIGHHVAVLHLF